MNDFKQINKEFSIIEAAQALGLESTHKLHEISPDDWRCKSVFNANENDTCTSIDPVKNEWFDFKENQGGGVLELWALIKYGSCNDIECKKKAAQDINDLAGGRFSNGDKNTPVVNSEALKFKAEFRSNVEKWHKILMSENPEAVKALQYLHDRRISDETIKRFKIGLCTQSIPTGEKDNGDKDIYVDELRLSFPYLNTRDEAIYLVTRRIDWLAGAKSPKYKKGVRTKETQFIKGEKLKTYLKNCPLGLNTIPLTYKNRDKIIIGEGVVDFLSIAQEHYSALFSVGGSFGEDNDAQLIEEASKFRRIITVFDSDEAGIKFTYRLGQKFMKAELLFYVVDSYGDGHKDISDYYTAGGSIPDLINKSRCGYIFMAEQLINQEFDGIPYWGLSKDKKSDMTTAIRKLFKGLNEMISPDEFKLVKEAILKYYPESLLKQAETGPSKAEKYTEQICRERDKFLRSNPDLFYTGSVRHGEYYGYNRETHYWQRLTDANVQASISELLLHQELPKTIEDITKSVRQKITRNERPKFNTKPLFGFKNGVLELDTGNFREHRAEDYLTFQVAYDYNVNAQCPRFDKFIQEVTAENQSRINFLDDMMAYILYHDCRLEKIFFLIGSGRNGKSVFMHILEALFKNANEFDTSQSVTHIQPKDFQEPTKRIMLSQSILNIAYDIDYNLKGCESYLKSIASGDVIDGNYKFCDTVHFASRAKIISSCNHMPVLRDSSEGMTRRPMFCKFSVDFEGREDKRLKDNIIAEELSGIFNRVYKAYQELVKRDEIRESDDQREFMHEFKEIANPMLVFWEYMIATNPDSWLDENENEVAIPKKDLYKNYKLWCEENKIRHVLPDNIFHREFKKTIKSLDNLKLKERRMRVATGEQQTYIYIIKILQSLADESTAFEESNIVSQETSISESETIQQQSIEYEDYIEEYADESESENNLLLVNLNNDDNEL